MVKPNVAHAIFAGVLENKKEKNGSLKITIKVGEQKFFVSVWDEELIAKFANYNIGQFIKVECNIKNNDYERDGGEKVYSFDFNAISVCYSSTKPYAKIKLLGRMTKEVEIKHFDAINEDFAIGTIAANTSTKNTTFINFLHRDFNENIGVLITKGLLVSASGMITVSKNGYTFYLNEIEEIAAI
jgi:hypothetical protein